MSETKHKNVVNVRQLNTVGKLFCTARSLSSGASRVTPVRLVIYRCAVNDVKVGAIEVLNSLEEVTLPMLRGGLTV